MPLVYPVRCWIEIQYRSPTRMISYDVWVVSDDSEITGYLLTYGGVRSKPHLVFKAFVSTIISCRATTIETLWLHKTFKIINILAVLLQCWSLWARTSAMKRRILKNNRKQNIVDRCWARLVLKVAIDCFTSKRRDFESSTDIQKNNPTIVSITPNGARSSMDLTLPSATVFPQRPGISAKRWLVVSNITRCRLCADYMPNLSSIPLAF